MVNFNFLIHRFKFSCNNIFYTTIFLFYLRKCIFLRRSIYPHVCQTGFLYRVKHHKLDAVNIRWMFILKVRVNLPGSFKLAYRVYTPPFR